MDAGSWMEAFERASERLLGGGGGGGGGDFWRKGFSLWSWSVCLHWRCLLIW